MRFSVAIVFLFAVFGVIFIGSSLQEHEIDDELMLGTWKAKGVSETECLISDVRVTLRIFEKVSPGQYRATYVERGNLTVKDDCRERLETDPGKRAPVDLGGGIVIVDIDGKNATIWSEHPDFHTEALELRGSRMIGADELGGIEYIKAFPEFRYDAAEGTIGWQAIRFPLCEAKQTTLDVIKECASFDAFIATFKEMMESAIREAMKGETKASKIERSGEYNYLDQFDGMTFEEIFDSALPDVSQYLTKEIASARKTLTECEECSEDELRKLREDLAERKEQREAMLEIQRARQ